ncbi:MAG: sigma 54-interacting transcriptional regulator [Thermoanaerobacteraceae bacterium]|nr:sigma 54-interacting transcriptional regulator [Thermoanaerobacteraceae bacterium]
MGLNLETQLRAVIESISDGIYMTDAEGTCIASNSAFKRITGIQENVVGKHVTYLLQNKIISDAVTLETISTRKYVSKIIKYPSGCEALVTGNPVFSEDGELLAVVCTVRDLTELNTLKEKLEKSKTLAEQYLATLKKLKAPFNTISWDKFIVRDSKMQRVLDLILRIADSDATVVLHGESGVGKGMIAHFIHEQSNRAKKGQFIKIDCGAIPPTLLESELFGYERGAFTGARTEGKTGLFELANHGTLFLDEIGEIPLSLQSKLLNVLQDKTIMRVGGTKPIPINIRIICATNKNLENMVTDGTFRADLFYRLNVIPITIPPLRERKEDILVLTVTFLKRFSEKYNRFVTILPEVIDYFLEYPWPGNVRELENTMERLVLLSQNGVIRLEDLPEKIKIYVQQQIKPPLEQTQMCSAITTNMELKKALAEVERNLIKLALLQNRTLAAAARSLGIDISTLLRKCRKYGIKRQEV